MTAVPVENVVIGLIWEHDRLLIAQRRPGSSYPLFWEFPGGKREEKETDAECLKREIREELGIEVFPFQELDSLLYPAKEGWRVIKPYSCVRVQGEPKSLGCKRFKWIAPRELSKYRFPPANRPLIQWLIRQKSFPQHLKNVFNQFSHASR